MKHIKEIVENVKGKAEIALTSGMKFLEENMGPLYPGELTLICGEVNNGKSALMIQQIHRMAIDNKVPVLVVLSGKDEKAFLACMAAYYCSIVVKDVHKVLIDPLYKDVIQSYMELIQQSPIYFISRNEFWQIESELSEFVIEKGIKTIFVERLLWLCMDSMKQRQLAIRLKELIIDLQVAMIAEFNIWQNEDYPPLSIEQLERDDIAIFADNIIGIIDFQQHRVFEDEKGNDLRGKVRMKIMKHNGMLAREKEIVFPRIQLLVRDIHNTICLGGDRNGLFADNSAMNRLRHELDFEVQDYFNF